MAPNKFEKHIKKALEQREIQPSAEAWDKLSEQLKGSSKTKKKGFTWYAVAASFIGLLIVSVLLFNGLNKKNAIENQVVKKPKKAQEIREQKDTEVVQLDTLKALKDNQPVERIVVEATKEIEPILNSEIVLTQDFKDDSSSARYEKSLDNSEQIINTKILEIVAQVDELEQLNNSVTEAEVDSLLRQAEQEVLNNKLFHADQSVDAMALLTEVEDELNQSFRDQIFNSLKSGFLKVRTAVADRNK